MTKTGPQLEAWRQRHSRAGVRSRRSGDVRGALNLAGRPLQLALA